MSQTAKPLLCCSWTWTKKQHEAELKWRRRRRKVITSQMMMMMNYDLKDNASLCVCVSVP